MSLFQVIPQGTADNNKEQKINQSSLAITNVLGLDNDSYLKKLYIMSLKKPTEYAEIQANLIKKLKHSFFTDVYAALYNLMTQGKDSVGLQILKDDQGNDLVPAVPVQEANRLILPICKALNSTLDEVLERVLPDFLEKQAHKRAAAVGQMELDLKV